MLGTHPNHSTGISSSVSNRAVAQFQDAAVDQPAGSNSSVSEHMTSMDHANNSTSSTSRGPIIAGNCISCMGMVRISQSMAVNTTVRCPHCQESFVLSELLDQSLPQLEVVTQPRESREADAPYIDTLHLKRDEQAAKPDKPRVKFEIPKALKDGARRRRRKRRSRSSSSSSTNGSERSRSSGSRDSDRDGNYVIVGSTPTSGDTTTMGEAIERRRSSRTSESGGGGASYRGKVKTHASRLKSAKPVWSMDDIVKIAAGCVLAIPVAYLMLFWIFRADPFGLAKPLSQVAPFMVPASMQANTEEAQPRVETPVRDHLEEEEPVLPNSVNKRRERIAIPNIDPDEVFGQEFGL